MSRQPYRCPRAFAAAVASTASASSFAVAGRNTRPSSELASGVWYLESVIGSRVEHGGRDREGGSYCTFGITVVLIVRPKPDQEPNVSSTAEASYPQCTMQ